MVGLGFFFPEIVWLQKPAETGYLTPKSSLAPAPIIQVSKL